MAQTDPLLMIPGPTNLPPQVREALGRPGFYHRGDRMAALLERCSDGLRHLMDTSGDALILTASGTGAMEAAITSLLSPGDPVLAIEGGKFGERLREIAVAYRADVTSYVVEPGHAADPGQVRDLLSKQRFTAVVTTYNETSTGVMHPVEQIAAATREAGALMICDCVSCLGGVPVRADEWGIDAVVAGSQKCLMLPPGLAFVGAGERAWEAAERASMPNYYLDLRRARASARKGQTPWTPATALIAALGAALDIIDAEGLEAVFARHAAMAEATRAAVTAAGLELFAQEGFRSPTVTAVHSPVDSSDLVRYLRERHGVLISGGQGELKGRIFRIGHMGTVHFEQIERTVEALADGLTNLSFGCDAAAMLDAARQAATDAGAEVN
jgi:aspartate aminotransferase-like enzyme